MKYFNMFLDGIALTLVVGGLGSILYVVGMTIYWGFFHKDKLSHNYITAVTETYSKITRLTKYDVTLACGHTFTSSVNVRMGDKVWCGECKEEGK